MRGLAAEMVRHLGEQRRAAAEQEALAAEFAAEQQAIKEQRQAAAAMQKRARGKQGRQAAQAVEQEVLAAEFEEEMRALREAREFEEEQRSIREQRKAATAVQSRSRGKQTRSGAAETQRLAAEFEEEQREIRAQRTAATAVQANVRGQLVRRKSEGEETEPAVSSPPYKVQLAMRTDGLYGVRIRQNGAEPAAAAPDLAPSAARRAPAVSASRGGCTQQRGGSLTALCGGGA